MADTETVQRPDAFDVNMARSGIESPRKDKVQPAYQMIADQDTRIPVSKHLGKVWRSRRDQAVKRRDEAGITETWSEVVAYYNNDQLGHRQATGGRGEGNRAGQIKREFTETENIVFANTTALVPVLYAKNPDIEITANKEANKKRASVDERLINELLRRRTAPGVNLKPKARRGVVTCVLTNLAYIEIGWTDREFSNDQALEDLAQLSQEYAKAKNTAEIEEVEGRLTALEQRMEMLQPAGPFAKFRAPNYVLVDPNSTEPDLSDARWVMIGDFVNTQALRAQYMRKRKGSGKEYELLFRSTHVMKLGNGAGEDEELSYTSIVNDTSEPKQYGYEDQETFDKNCVTLVWYVWDKVTRRVLMFNDKDWAWPIWVWDDPYRLDTFYPIYPLSFYTSPMGGESKGEMTYILDQQDAINTINSQQHLARTWASRNVFFNSNVVSQDTINKVLKGDTNTAIGIKLKDGQSIGDVVMSVTPPSVKMMELFNKQPIYEAIHRISSVPGVMQGVEYKTNTTNRAIQSYESNTMTRFDEKVDAVEDWIGAIGWGLLQLCLQFMSPEEVMHIVGDDAAGWTNVQPEDIRQMYVPQVVGGSAVKPTSQAKKEMAVQISQILGQFADASPAAVMVALKVLSGAFDEVVITDQDWELVMQGIEAAMARIGGGNGSSGAGSGNQSDPQQVAQVAAQFIDSLPENIRAAIGQALQQGAPAAQIIQQLMQRMQQGQQNDQPQETANAAE